MPNIGLSCLGCTLIRVGLHWGLGLGNLRSITPLTRSYFWTQDWIRAGRLVSQTKRSIVWNGEQKKYGGKMTLNWLLFVSIPWSPTILPSVNSLKLNFFSQPTKLLNFGVSSVLELNVTPPLFFIPWHLFMNLIRDHAKTRHLSNSNMLVMKVGACAYCGHVPLIWPQS